MKVVADTSDEGGAMTEAAKTSRTTPAAPPRRLAIAERPRVMDRGLNCDWVGLCVVHCSCWGGEFQQSCADPRAPNNRLLVYINLCFG
jgi:hypothetical protein